MDGESFGSSMMNVAPAPGSLVTVIEPPICFTISREIQSPSPRPPKLRVGTARA
jgi:hypothetical protein